MLALYPKAVWKGNGVSGGSYIGVPWRLVLHTTETEVLPSYDSGAFAPHLTYSPKTRTFYQHTSLLTAARSLRNEPGGIETNRANAIQLEIICYSNKPLADAEPSRLWVGDLSPENLSDIREFAEWLGVPPVWPGKQAASYAAANAAGFRMTESEWYAYNGICGHQHVPESDHWDPGMLDWDSLLSLGKENDTMWPINKGDGTKNQRPEKAEDIKNIQARMNMLGIKPPVKVDGSANQKMLDKFFELVGSPAGGSFISGEEGAKFELAFIQLLGGKVDKVARSSASSAHKRLDALHEI